MSESILNFYQPGQQPARLVSDEVHYLAEAYANDPQEGSPAKKIENFLGTIVFKCARCCEGENGRLVLDVAADCPDDDCPLHDIGPVVFQAVRARIRARTGANQ